LVHTNCAAPRTTYVLRPEQRSSGRSGRLTLVGNSRGRRGARIPFEFYWPCSMGDRGFRLASGRTSCRFSRDGRWSERKKENRVRRARSGRRAISYRPEGASSVGRRSRVSTRQRHDIHRRTRRGGHAMKSVTGRRTTKVPFARVTQPTPPPPIGLWTRVKNALSFARVRAMAGGAGSVAL